METIYYDDHDQRYGHIPERERALYPDELIIGERPFAIRVIRDKTLEEIHRYGKPEGMRGINIYLLAKDTPYTLGTDDAH